VLDACDTASVREGLLDDALLAKLVRVHDQLVVAAASGPFATPDQSLSALAPPPTRAHLADRLHALRAGRRAAGEPDVDVDIAVAAIGDAELAALAPALATCQLWYCEAATSGLTPSAQLGVLAIAVGAARRLGVDVTRPWHAQLRPLVAQLHGDTPAVRYRLRLVEAALARRSLRELLTGTPTGPLGTLSTRLAATGGDDDAIVVDYLDTPESASLVTLLGLYETRSQAQFHAMLKALCDLYGLRKDDLDRVNNEASYLASMNGARSDKARMLAFVVPGRIVEIGPGGGVVLDLLEGRFPDADVIGVDLSREVVDALTRRAAVEHHRWRVIHGRAQDLGALVGDADTIILCSILHEIFSYTEPRFSLDHVRDVLRAAFAALRPGGRIVIRDGVMPPPATRRIRFVAPGARDTFALYVAQFEGRPIPYRELAPDRVELSSADAMEFLYTYTWGPASFPYEVREQYGIATYDDYVAHIASWLGPTAHLVDTGELRSYLQPGYRDHLAGAIELTDERDRPVALPDSNCVIAVERR
jgi:SAM-dependent methyltransferase